MRVEPLGADTFDIKFEVDQDTGLFENGIAISATGLNPHNVDILGLDEAEQITWDTLAVKISNAGQSYGPHIPLIPVPVGELARPLHITKVELKALGTALLYFYDTTHDAIHLMSQQGQQGINTAARRAMKWIAIEMCEAIRHHVDIPEPASRLRVAKDHAVGFTPNPS